MTNLYDVQSSIMTFFADIRVYIGGIVLFGATSYQIKGHHEREIVKTLKPGDVLLRRYNHYLGSLFIPGYWSHAAIYVGNDNVIHMLGDGIAKEDILTFMRCDDLRVLRCNDSVRSDRAVNKAQDYHRMRVGYDFSFDFDDKSKMSCTELINACYGDLEFKQRKNKKHIIPDDFLNSIFKTVWTKE